MMESFCLMHHASPVGFVADDVLSSTNSKTLCNQLTSLVQNLKSASDLEWKNAKGTFLQLGGEKIFRDEVYGGLSMTFPGDHRAYKKLGIYKTFPQKSRSLRLMSVILRLFIRMKWFREGMYQMFEQGGNTRQLMRIVEEQQSKV